VSHADEREAARAHFKSGLEHVQHGELAAAIEAFESAYQTSPNYAVLYNLGQAYAAVGRRADAVRTLERFLVDGGERIEPERRNAVETMLERERARLGTLELAISPAEAEVFVDGRRRASGRSGPEALDPGEHVVVARLSGYQTRVAAVELAVGQTVRLDLTLEPDHLALPPPAASVSRRPTFSPPIQPAVPPVQLNAERNWALGLGIGGLVLAGTAVGLFAWNTDRYHTWQGERDRFDAMPASGSSGSTIVAESHAVTDRAVAIQRVDDLALGAAVAAGVALASAAALWFTRSHVTHAPALHGQGRAH
jgi:hypothetical protein